MRSDHSVTSALCLKGKPYSRHTIIRSLRAAEKAAGNRFFRQVKSSRFAWVVERCTRPVRATALHGQQMLECPWKASQLCAKNSVRSDRHVWGAYQCFWHSSRASLDCRPVTQAQRAGKRGSANCRSRHPTRTPFGRASWSPRLLHRRALANAEYCLPGCAVRRNGPLPRVLDRTKKLEIYLLLMLTAALRSTAYHFEGTHSAASAMLKSLAARDCPLWGAFFVHGKCCLPFFNYSLA
jgi:hypothetical protein